MREDGRGEAERGRGALRPRVYMAGSQRGRVQLRACTGCITAGHATEGFAWARPLWQWALSAPASAPLVPLLPPPRTSTAGAGLRDSAAFLARKACCSGDRPAARTLTCLEVQCRRRGGCVDRDIGSGSAQPLGRELTTPQITAMLRSVLPLPAHCTQTVLQNERCRPRCCCCRRPDAGWAAVAGGGPGSQIAPHNVPKQGHNGVPRTWPRRAPARAPSLAARVGTAVLAARELSICPAAPPGCFKMRRKKDATGQRADKGPMPASPTTCTVVGVGGLCCAWAAVTRQGATPVFCKQPIRRVNLLPAGLLHLPTCAVQQASTQLSPSRQKTQAAALPNPPTPLPTSTKPVAQPRCCMHSIDEPTLLP